MKNYFTRQIYQTNVLLSIMNQTNVPIKEIKTNFEELSPELKKAARFVMENPNEVGISSVREIAEAANVKPNTFVRMAHQLGFNGYEDFRQPFREMIRNGEASFPDRARWLQNIKQQGEMGDLYVEMVSSAIRNIEETFATIKEVDLQAASKIIWASRNVFVLGVGVNNANARNFTYLASTGMVSFHSIPRAGSVATDDLAWANENDVLIAITCKPYRIEVLEAIDIAKEQGVKVIGISDSEVSPVILKANYGFIVKIDTPQFFPSSVSTIALLETLLSFVIANASDDIVRRVEKFHKRRYHIGLYHGDGV